MTAKGKVKTQVKRRALWWGIGAGVTVLGGGGVAVIVGILLLGTIMLGATSTAVMPQDCGPAQTNIATPAADATGSTSSSAPTGAPSSASSSSIPQETGDAGDGKTGRTPTGETWTPPKPGPYSGHPHEQAKPGVTPGPIPANMEATFKRVAAYFEIPWLLLAAISWEEMKHGAVTKDSGPGAQGPMQFMPPTWEAYGMDGNGDGIKDVYNIEDAVAGAANYLVASGLKNGDEESVRGALFAYNRANWYVNDILAWFWMYADNGYVRGEDTSDGTNTNTDTGSNNSQSDGCGDTEAEEPAPPGPAGEGAADSTYPGDASGEAVHPLPGARVTSRFGPRWGTTHLGLDLAAPMYTPIYSASSGVVVKAGEASGFGYWVVIDPGADGWLLLYGHIEEFYVTEGQTVVPGQHIAAVGNRGNSTGPHLHFEIRKGFGTGVPRLDPEKWLAERGVTI